MCGSKKYKDEYVMKAKIRDSSKYLNTACYMCLDCWEKSSKDENAFIMAMSARGQTMDDILKNTP